MKIVHLILGKANPERMNGVNKVVHYLATAQAEIGQEVSVWGITPTPGDPVPEQRAFTTRLFRARANKLALDGRLVQALNQLDRDTIVHMHGSFIPEFIIASGILRRRDIPYVITQHGAYNTVAMQKNRRIKEMFYILFEKKMISKAHKVQLIGKSEFVALERKSGLKNLALIPNGQSMISEEGPRKNINMHDIPIFGFMGRMDLYTKGLDILLMGFAEYLKENKGMLLMMGDGQDIALVKKLASDLGIEKEVQFLGSKYGQEKEKALLGMDAFFHPSRNEGMPGAVLEAAALGIPCVVSEETNVREYIEKYQSGIGLSLNGPIEIADSMRHILKRKQDGTLNTLGENAQRMIREEFDWKIIARRLVNTYHASE